MFSSWWWWWWSGFSSSSSAAAAEQEEASKQQKQEAGWRRWCLLVAAVVAYRCCNALLVQTYFAADEYWQSLEVAHNTVFGYGYLTWEWRPHARLRSYLHPLPFAALYKLLQLLSLDFAEAVAYGPRLLQALLQVVGDVYTYKLADSHCGPFVARWTMVVQLLSWFTFYCGVRTLSNSAEAVLCTVVLYHWPWQPSLLPASVLRRKRVISVALATLTVLLRPTSALIWAFLGLHHLLLCKDRFRFVFVHVAPTAGAVLAAGGVVDRVMYGEWTFVPYNFVYFNVMKGVGSFYGTHAWHWYLSQGLPTILITYLPLFLAGVYLSRRYLLASLVLWTVFWYSLLAHKEFRFLFAMLPVTNLYSGYALNWLWQYYYDPRKKHDNNDSRCDGDASSAKDQTNNQQSKDRRNKLQEQRLQQRQRSAGERKGGPQGRGGERGRGARWQRWMVVGVIFVVMVGQVVPALYLSVVHQRGPLQVMRYLREEHAAGRLRNDSAVHFLTPCHATPFYSHLHAPIPMQFLTCEPPPTGQLTHEYKDESDLFFEDPAGFLATYYPPNISINSNGEVINMLPTHIVTFSGVAQLIANFLQHNSYVECGRFFHSHISGDWRQGPYLLVFCHGG